MPSVAYSSDSIFPPPLTVGDRVWTEDLLGPPQ